MIDFLIEDCTHTIDLETEQLIARLVLAWARYDSQVTQWAIRAFGMEPDEGTIIIGNMDTKTKLERIKKLHLHFGQLEQANWIAEIGKLHKEQVDVRNAICHKMCAGHHRREPNYLIFADPKPPSQKVGHMTIIMHHLDQLKTSTSFATKAADEISGIVDAYLDLLEESRAQSDAKSDPSPPSPQGSES